MAMLFFKQVLPIRLRQPRNHIQIGTFRIARYDLEAADEQSTLQHVKKNTRQAAKTLGTELNLAVRLKHEK